MLVNLEGIIGKSSRKVNYLAIVGWHDCVDEGRFSLIPEKSFEISTRGRSIDWVVWLKKPTDEQKRVLYPAMTSSGRKVA